MTFANSGDPVKKGLESEDLKVSGSSCNSHREHRDPQTRALAVGRMEEKKYMKGQHVAVKRSIKLSKQLNARGKNKGSNICFWFG